MVDDDRLVTQMPQGGLERGGECLDIGPSELVRPRAVVTREKEHHTTTHRSTASPAWFARP